MHGAKIITVEGFTSFKYFTVLRSAKHHRQQLVLSE